MRRYIPLEQIEKAVQHVIDNSEALEGQEEIQAKEHPEVYKRLKRAAERNRKLKVIQAWLVSDGCV